MADIRFRLDNDKPGRGAAERLMEKYYQPGYEVSDFPPLQGCKDYNEWLVKAKHIGFYGKWLYGRGFRGSAPDRMHWGWQELSPMRILPQTVTDLWEGLGRGQKTQTRRCAEAMDGNIL